jgi:hypothetical protein
LGVYIGQFEVVGTVLATNDKKSGFDIPKPVGVKILRAVLSCTSTVGDVKIM